jgi:8-amino-7-oxononanoate synthase
MVTSLEKRLQATLDSRKARSNLRSLNPIPNWAPQDSSKSPQTQTNLIDFSSNDYLSFASSPHLYQILQKNLLDTQESPFGPSSSRLLDGNTPLHQKLENDLTKFFKGSAGLLFNSGFDANVSIWSTIPGPNDWVVYDSLIHASIHDGLRLSRAPVSHQVPFLHNSLTSLEKTLKDILLNDVDIRSGRTNLFISVEALYSMDGDLCPLKEIVSLVDSLFSKLKNAHIVVDEVSNLLQLNDFHQRSCMLIFNSALCISRLIQLACLNHLEEDWFVLNL